MNSSLLAFQFFTKAGRLLDQVDLTDWAATRAAIAPLPRMDGLVNNAAVAICTPFLQVKPEEFDL